MKDNLYQLLSGLNAQAASVRSDYNDLFDSDTPTIPIPFFGDLHTARVVTVGLNPSDGEFKDRSWPQSMDTPQLNERLTQYFCNSQVEPYKWFTTWEKALNQIGASYKNGTAAHIDLCPWPTKSAGSFNTETANRKKFIQLASQSLPSFWRCLQAASHVRLVIMAGTVTKEHNMNDFVTRFNPSTDFSLQGKVTKGGDAHIGWQCLHLPEKELPVFYCSVSPSNWAKKDLLIARVSENQKRLREYLE